ncbi:MAG: hypothetical protein RBR59_04715, partial [Sulfurimonadaceae bacterium]|nr:hypothetical protein [Sulfurimonadaceae bacterium]
MLKNLFFVLFLAFSTSYAKENTITNKAVFDCAAKDLTYIATRLQLIEKTYLDFAELNQKSDFILTIHSHCTPIVSNDALFFYTEKESEVIKNIHKQLKKLSLSYHVEIRACEIALKHFNIDKSDLLQEI